MPRLAAVLALVALVVGCVTPAHAPAPASSSDAAVEAAIGTPIRQGAEHNHADPAQHQHSFGMERVALVTGHEGGSIPPGESYAETAVKGGYAYLTRYGPESGIAIFDVKDVEHPRFVSAVRLDEGFEPDVEVTDDGHWAFWETQRFPVAPTVPDLANPISNAPHGVHIVDIKDKAHPKDVGFYPVTPDGPHSITYANVSGRTILFLSVYAFAYAYSPDQASVEPPKQQRLEIAELDLSGPVPTLKKLAEYVEPGSEGKGHGNFPHDVSIQKHPVTGQWLAYVGYWDQGVVILDVGDPSHPKEIGKATDFGPTKYRQVHMARAFPELIDGKHVTVVEPEHDGTGGSDTGAMTFLDTTDPTRPTYISSWTLPGNLTAEGLTFSPHYFDVSDDGRVALASYHAGAWVIDAHDAAHLARPTATAFAEMPGTGAAGVGPFASGTGSAFDAWWYEGHVVVGDSSAGLAIYKLASVTPHAP